MKYNTTDKPTRPDYCRYLMISQTDYTPTCFGEHGAGFGHDAINRLPRDDKATPAEAWKRVRGQVIESPDGYLAFDDTVPDKNRSHGIEIVRRRWSGNEKRVVKGIGAVACVYANPELERFRIIDYRIYDPDTDGGNKPMHAQDMPNNAVRQKRLPFRTVLTDTRYAAKEFMLLIERLGKIYYCPPKSNRPTDDSNGERPYRHVGLPEWTDDEVIHGKAVKIKGFPKEHRVKPVRVASSARRTDYIVTDDKTRSNAQAVKKICGFRRKIERFHRETEQATGIERCRCRKARIVRNRIGCAMLVRVRMKQIAERSSRTIYGIKEGLLAGYLRRQLINPDIKMAFA